MNREVDVVRRLYKVAYEARIPCITIRGCECRLVIARRDVLGIRYRKRLMLEDSRNVAQVLSIDRAEIKVLVAEAQEELAPSDRGRAIAHDGPKTLIG